MQIKNKLSIYFTVISSLLMLLIMTFIYALFAVQVKKDFYALLHERTKTAAQVYLEADEVTNASLDKVKQKFVISLPHEVIGIYNSNSEQSFIRDTAGLWSKEVIEKVRRRRYLQYSDGTRQFVGINYDDNQGDFVILASAIDVGGTKKKKHLLEIMSVLFGIQIIVQFWAGRWLSKRLLQPIQKINAKVKIISASDLHLRVPVNNEKDELGVLAGNFNQLLERLEQSFNLQKMFVANASHELKTPVTNIIGEIDVALSKDRQVEGYKRTLESVLVEADRIDSIIRNFLFLANAETNVSLPKEELRLDEFLWETRDDINKQFSGKVSVDFKKLPDELDKLAIMTNKALLSIAVNNIIHNGIKFSGGQRVSCSLDADDNFVTISIADQGIGMHPETLKNIFEPFYRSDNTGNYKGHGIGLYLAKKMIMLLDGSIDVQSTPGAGSTFNIKFRQN